MNALKLYCDVSDGFLEVIIHIMRIILTYVSNDKQTNNEFI